MHAFISVKLVSSFVNINRAFHNYFKTTRCIFHFFWNVTFNLMLYLSVQISVNRLHPLVCTLLNQTTFNAFFVAREPIYLPSFIYSISAASALCTSIRGAQSWRRTLEQRQNTTRRLVYRRDSAWLVSVSRSAVCALFRHDRLLVISSSLDYLSR